MGIKVLKTGMIKGNPNIECIDRIIKVVREAKDIALENGISNVVIEDVQLQYKYNGFQKGRVPINVDTFKKLSNLQGLLYGRLTEEEIKVHIMGSSTWKSIMEIKGRARAEQKQNAKIKVKTLYKLSVNSDISDSICLGTAWIKDNNFIGTVLSIDQATLASGYAILKSEVDEDEGY